MFTGILVGIFTIISVLTFIALIGMVVQCNQRFEAQRKINIQLVELINGVHARTKEIERMHMQ